MFEAMNGLKEAGLVPKCAAAADCAALLAQVSCSGTPEHQVNVIHYLDVVGSAFVSIHVALW